MPAGQQVAFQPALAHVLAQDFHHPAGARHVVVGQYLRHGNTIGGFKDRVQPVRVGLVRPHDRKFAVAILSLTTSRSNLPRPLVALMNLPGFGTSTAYDGNPACAGRAAADRRSHADSLPCADCLLARAPPDRHRTFRSHQTVFPVYSSASSLQELDVLRRLRSATGTWCERNVPSICSPSMTFGPVHPFGLRRMIIGQRGRSVSHCSELPVEFSGFHR